MLRRRLCQTAAFFGLLDKPFDVIVRRTLQIRYGGRSSPSFHLQK